MWITSKRDSHCKGCKGREQNDGKGDTQRHFHGRAPFSGANVRKMSLDSFVVFLKAENEAKTEENVQNAKRGGENDADSDPGLVDIPPA
jgi:hypothetical protein